MSLIQVIIDDSTDKTITGSHTYDRDSGGCLVVSSGSVFPGSPVAKEIFWRSDEDKLYRRNDANTAWDTIVAAAGVHTLGGASHTADTLVNLNAKVSDATLIDTGDSRLSDNRNDAAAIHKAVAAEISALTEKTTPISGDHLIIEDSAASNVKRRVQIGNLPAPAVVEEYHEWDATGASSTSTSYVTAATLTFTPNTASEDWEIFWSFGAGITAGADWIFSRINFDTGTEYFAEHQAYTDGPTNVEKTRSGVIKLISLSAAAHTISVQFHLEDGYDAAYCRDVYIRARKI